MKHNERATPRRAGRASGWRVVPRWRVTRGVGIALGPGKAGLLDAIARTGSISAAAADQGMSYRRAWMLVAEMNACFARPLVATSAQRRRGALLTDDGREVLRLYRRLESRATAATRDDVKALLRLLRRATASRRHA
jgi:molybdate transport system regulatory protein